MNSLATNPGVLIRLLHAKGVELVDDTALTLCGEFMVHYAVEIEEHKLADSRYFH